MGKLFLVIAIIYSSMTNAKVSYNPENCHKELESEARRYMTDYKWEQPLTEMSDLFKSLYSSEKRISYRAYLVSLIHISEPTRQAKSRMPSSA